MPHRYIDTSDLNAPYDQYRGAAPLQGLGAAQHLYMDYSNLNAQYDRSRPAIHGLGSGSLGGSALGNVDGKLIGIGEVPEGCPVWTGAHHRMQQGLAAMSGDVELMAIWNHNTARWGCPVRGEFHWFWPNAPTREWWARGPVERFVEDDWAATNQSWTLFIPPFVEDMSQTFLTGLPTAVSPSPLAPAPAQASVAEITPQIVASIQSAINTQLSSMGCRSIAVDGDAGPETCGAIAYLGDQNTYQLTAEMRRVMETMGDALVKLVGECTEAKYGCTGPAQSYSPSSLHTLSTPAKAGVSSGTLLVGAAVAVAVGLVGAAVIYKRGT